MLQMKLLNLPALISKPFSTTTYGCSSRCYEPKLAKQYKADYIVDIIVM